MFKTPTLISMDDWMLEQKQAEKNAEQEYIYSAFGTDPLEILIKYEEVHQWRTDVTFEEIIEEFI